MSEVSHSLINTFIGFVGRFAEQRAMNFKPTKAIQINNLAMPVPSGYLFPLLCEFDDKPISVQHKIIKPGS